MVPCGGASALTVNKWVDVITVDYELDSCLSWIRQLLGLLVLLCCQLIAMTVGGKSLGGDKVLQIALVPAIEALVL